MFTNIMQKRGFCTNYLHRNSICGNVPKIIIPFSQLRHTENC